VIRALQLATEVLPHFRANVLRGWVRTYGHYATAIGRSEAKEAIVVGKAMHLIGAACVMARVPVAPVHFVERADGEWRGIFESAASEHQHVLPAWDTLAVSSRVYSYTDQDFEKLGKVLNELIPKHFPPTWQSPKKVWLYLIHTKIEGQTTWLTRALSRYEEIIVEAKRARNPS
jgi:hypothetical protein